MNSIEKVVTALKNHLAIHYMLPAELSNTIEITLTTDAAKHQFGDITCNAPLMLAKHLGKNPRVLAQEITSNFSHPAIAEITVAGPGFINMRLTLDTFKTILNELSEHKEYFFMLDTHAPRTSYSVEFVSANPTGPMHLGHGRNGIIGDVLGNVLRFIGHEVTKEFYINDAGAQIAKLGESFKARVMQCAGHEAALPEGGYQGDYLVELARQALAHEGPDIVHNELDFFADYAKNALLADLQTTLADYGITFDVWFSEKTLHTSGDVERAIQKLTDHGHTYTADGALWFKSTAFGDDKDRVLKKQSGELTYVASDVAYLENKIARGAEKLILVLGQDHHSYVTRLKGIMSALGHNPDALTVILYQLVTLKESGAVLRMSKRAGHMLMLKDIINAVGKDSARFFYLHRKADAHLEFDVELALKHTDENPVYYIQYAYVRTGSIQEKAQQFPELQALTTADSRGLEHTELLLLKKLVALKEVLNTISLTYQGHVLSYYAFELAHLFHRYYAENRVIDLNHIPQSRARLLLVQEVRMTLATVLKLLGIDLIESM